MLCSLNLRKEDIIYKGACFIVARIIARVMCTRRDKFCKHHAKAPRAVIENYERKNGISMPGYCDNFYGIRDTFKHLINVHILKSSWGITQNLSQSEIRIHYTHLCRNRSLSENYTVQFKNNMHKVGII